MSDIRKNKLNIELLEKRLMLDASLGALATTTVLAEDTVNASPQILDSDVSVTGSTTDFDGIALDVSSGGTASESLDINDEGTGAGQIGFDGTTVTYGGVAIGTASSNGAGGNDLTIDLNASASKAAIERLIENVTYQNTNDDPVLNRTINFSLDGGLLFSEDMTVTIVPQNEAPTINANNGMTLNEGATEVLTAAMLDVSDPDNTDSEVTFTIASALTNGRLELSSNAGVSISSFTLDDLNSGIVRYVHDGTDTTSDSFTFDVDDGTDTLATATFNITVTAVNDPFALDTNDGAEVFAGNSTDIGGGEVPAKFGNVLHDYSAGTYGTFESTIDSQSTQISVIFTTGANPSSGYPGEVLFETGGSGRGIGLYIDNQNDLVFYFGNATNSPRMTSNLSLATNMQYAVVMEIDQGTNEIRMHYAQAGDFTWFEFGRPAEVTETFSGDLSGSNGTGIGQVGNGSYGGFNGSASGQNTFQGSLDSNVVITAFPSGGTIIQNTNLVASDVDTAAANLVYTITTDAAFGSITLNSVDIGLGDTFTQADLDSGLVDYTHGGGATGDDSFVFSLSDGTTTLTNQTYTISVTSTNTAPVITVADLTVAEDASNSSNVGSVEASDAEASGGQVLTWSITGGTGAGIFAIDSSNGLVTVADNSTLDYETTTSYTLIVRVTDDAGSPLFDEETITINVQDVYEGTAPTFTGTGPFSVDENVANNTVVGTVTATDAEGDGVSFSIVGGNVNSAFKIDNNGIIRVNGTDKIDFEDRGTYTLTVRATDDSVDNLTRQTTVTITVNDLNEAPVLDIGDVIGIIDKNVDYNATNGNFYRYFNNNVNFNTALSNAAAETLNGANGHMVTITSASENAFVDSILGSHIWLAASDADVEGEWKWIAGPEEGSVFSIGGTATSGFYEKWSGSEPNSGTGANYAYMNTNSNWYDQGGGSRRYVVEWESYDVINNRDYSLNYSAANGTDITNGTSVGSVQAADDDGDAISYSITAGNDDGIFAIDASTGEITIADNTNINTSITSDFTLTIRVDDGSGLFDTTNVDINFNQLFSITQNNTLSAAEGADTIITSAALQTSDSDSAASDLVYTVTTVPTNGQLELSTSPGAAITSFTQDDIDNNRLIYASDGAEVNSDSFVFSITDGATTLSNQTFDITVTPVNDAPTINVNTGTSVLEGGSQTITAAMLNSLDADDADTALTFTASNYVNGHIEVNGVTQNTFTQDDINNSMVVFVHDGAETDATFDVTLVDDEAAGTDSATFTLTKTNVNDAPSLTTNTGTTVTEGSTTVIDATMLSASDSDDSGTGLIYSLSNIQNGQVELTTNSGIPVLSFTQDDLDNSRVVFRHDSFENDGTFDVSVADGGEDGAGTDSATFTVTKLPVNDAPTVLRNLGTSVNQNSIVVLKNAVFAAADSDDSASGITFTVSNLVSGQVEYLANPNVAITSFMQDDINNSLVVFRHAGAVGPASFDFEIADGGEDGAGTATGTFNFTVDNTNDSPTITTNVAQTIDEGATLSITTAMLDSFDADDFGTGLSWTASNLSNGILQVNGVTQNSFTQADLDNGLVTFVHDDSETVSAGFDIQVADGGEDASTPDTATFSITVTPVNEAPVLSVNDGNPQILDLNDYTFNPYSSSPSQDEYSNIAISGDGTTITFTDSNAWKEIDISHTLTANTVLSFEFQADATWEIIGLGFENGNADFNFLGYELHGTQNWNLNDSYRGYQVGDGWVRYDITVGADFSPGDTLTEMIFAIDNDADKTGNISFRNIGFYESDQILDVDEGGTFNITTAHITASDIDDTAAGLTYTASNIRNGVVQVNGVTSATFTQDDIENNRVTFVHDGSETLNAGFDISLADGLEDGVTAQTGSFNLIINAVDDAPLAATNNGMTTATEGGTTTLTTAMLTTTDVDTEPRKVVFTVTDAVDNGRLELSSNAGNSITSFTLKDLQDGIVRYVHDGGESVADSFDFTVKDETTTLAGDTFNITITPVNDAVSLDTNTGTNVTESGTVTITSTMLSSSDVDDAVSGITYMVADISNGWVELTTNAGFPASSFTQDDVDNNRVVFRHDGSGAGTASFDFSVQDGGEDSAAATTGTFSVNVNTAVNEGPVIALSDGTAPTTIDFSAETILAYDPSGAGDGQSSSDTAYMVSSDGSVLTIYGNSWKKIAFPYTLTADTVLTFDYRSTKEAEIHGIGFDTDDSITNGISAYNLFGTDNNALFDHTYNTYNLGDGWTRYEITVGDNFTGAVTHLFFAADDDAGADAISQFRDVSVYESGNGIPVAEGGSVTITNSYLNTFDTDHSAANLTYTVSNLTNGVVQVSGVTSATFTQADIDAGDVVFVHDDSETITASFDVSVSDGALSDTVSVNFTVTPVNEAPTITGDLALAANEGGNVTLVAADLGFSDVDDTATGVTYTASNLSNGIIQVNGVTQNIFTADDVINGLVVFIHDGSETTSAGFDVVLADGGEDGAGTDSASVSITISPVNDNPTAVSLSNNSLIETAATGSVIGTLSTTDVDLPSDSFSYSIVADPDGKFAINGNQLVLNGTLDFEIDISHNVTIRTDDGNGGTFDQMLTVNVSDNTAPTEILLDASSVRENAAINTVIGAMGASDPDSGDVMSYNLLDDAGGLFAMNNGNLVVNGAIDFELLGASTEITVRVSDLEGNIFDQVMTIAITDVNEAVGDIVTLERDENRGGLRLIGSLFNGRNTDDTFRVRDLVDLEEIYARSSLIQAAISGNADQQSKAFYGQSIQIVQENAILQLEDIRRSIGDFIMPSLPQAVGENLAPVQDIGAVLQGDGGENGRDIVSAAEQLKAALIQIQMEQDGADGEKSAAAYIYSDVEVEFEAILNYHKNKQDALLKALRAES